MGNFKNVVYEIARKPDAAVFASVRGIAEATGVKIEKLTYVPSWNSQSLMIEGARLDADEAFQELLGENLSLIRSFSWALSNGVAVNVGRDEKRTYDKVTVVLSPFDQKPATAPTNLGAFIASVKKHYSELLTADALGENAEQTRRHYEARDEAVGRLESALASVGQVFTSEAAQQRTALLEEVEAERKAAREALAIEQSKSDARIEAQRKALEEREAGLAERLKEVDDQAATHARRQIRQDLKDELASRSETFRLTSGTRSLRQPVAITALTLMCVFGTFFVWGLAKAFAGEIQDTSTLVRQVSLGLGFVSSTIFYLRWQNRWFEQHAQEEFRLKRLALDVDRASWVVEMAMEWRDEKGSELPKDLLDRLTSNLFEEADRKDEPLHPADQLASALFGASSAAKLKLPNGSSVELDRKSVRQLQRDGD